METNTANAAESQGPIWNDDRVKAAALGCTHEWQVIDTFSGHRDQCRHCGLIVRSAADNSPIRSMSDLDAFMQIHGLKAEEKG